MMKDIEKAKSLLREGDYTCVLICGDRVLTDIQRGVAPLLKLIDSGEDFSLFCAADKVVGKGAALLYIKMKIKELHAEVMSKSAAEALTKHGIAYTYGTLTDYIVNRKGDGMCPMEKATLDTDDPEVGFNRIRSLIVGD